MRSPSGRCLINICTIDHATAVPDGDGGPRYVYAGPGPALACSAQPVRTDEVLVQEQLVMETTWRVMFPVPTGVGNRDRMIITDPAGVAHTAYALIEQDQAGRGAAYVVHAIERR